MTLEDLQDPFYVDGLDPALLVPHYLIHCYLYYEFCRALIEDSVFDALARRLADEWDGVDHPHKDLIDPDGLSSGGHYLKYPLRVQQCAKWLIAGAPDPPEEDDGEDWSVL